MPSLLRNAARIEEQQQALENYIDYVKNIQNRPTFGSTGQGNYSPRGRLRRIALRPFSLDLPAGNYAEAFVSDRAFGQLSATVGARIKTDATALGSAFPLRKFKPAKLVFFNGSGALQTTRSKFTKLYYRKRQGTSYTISFGQASAGETFAEGAAALMTAMAAANTENNRVWVQPEKYNP